MIELNKPLKMVLYCMAAYSATLNPASIRIGTAEIYRVIDALDEVLESIAITHEDLNSPEINLFVHLVDGLKLTQTLFSASSTCTDHSG